MLKGNLLFNGDFETGTTEGWINGAYGMMREYQFSVTTDDVYLGNYAGKLTSLINHPITFMAYDKLVSFEEYEAYLYVSHHKIVLGDFCYALLYGVDDKDNLMGMYALGYVNKKNTWGKIIALLRQFNDNTHFKVGVYYQGVLDGGEIYLDEFRLIPLRSIKSVILRDYNSLTNLTANEIWYVNLAMMGPAKVYSEVEVLNVGGTSPTLDIKLAFYHINPSKNIVEKSHTQFSSEGKEIITQEVTDFSFIKVEYTVGGTDPTFDIRHLITAIPL